jgi:hypothetical protein
MKNSASMMLNLQCYSRFNVIKIWTIGALLRELERHVVV